MAHQARLSEQQAAAQRHHAYTTQFENDPFAIVGDPNATGLEKSPLQQVFSVMFPKFTPNSFLGRVCILQVANYVGSLFLTMGSAATDNALATAMQGASMAVSPNTCSLYLLGASWGSSRRRGGLVDRRYARDVALCYRDARKDRSERRKIMFRC